MEEIMEELKKIKNKLIEEVNPLVIILFGSYCRGTQTFESDIDIAFKGKTLDKVKMFELKRELEDITNKDIDLINLDDIGDGFRYEILMNGISIYCKDPYEFDMYKIDMLREYLELNEARKSIIDNVKKGGTIYGK